MKFKLIFLLLIYFNLNCEITCLDLNSLYGKGTIDYKQQIELDELIRLIIENSKEKNSKLLIKINDKFKKVEFPLIESFVKLKYLNDYCQYQKNYFDISKRIIEIMTLLSQLPAYQYEFYEFTHFIIKKQRKFLEQIKNKSYYLYLILFRKSYHSESKLKELYYFFTAPSIFLPYEFFNLYKLNYRESIYY